MGKICGRILALIPAVLLQVLIAVLLLTVLEPYAFYIYAALEVIAVIATIEIISQKEAPSYKQVWMLFILVVPAFGILMYLLFGNKKAGKKLQGSLEHSREELHWEAPESETFAVMTPGPDKIRAAETFYEVHRMTGMPAYRCGETRYYSVGEESLEDLLADLRKAEKYIFMEYFIVNAGTFLDRLVEVLAERAHAGVDVRIMYDDLGSIATFSRGSAKKLEEKGIRVLCFNPLTRITPRVNNRDHRKMTVIDGRIAYSGGINLADEYLNIGSRYGHWKDLVFRLEGDAAISYAFMFTEFWNAFSGEKIPVSYLPDTCSDTGTNGYVLSYYENPVGQFHVSNQVYIDLLSQATGYIWFYTPYLMLDDTLLYAFLNAAGRGVDVRIILPGIPDKKIAYRLARSYYGLLLSAGVRIYEYTPGFVHAKACVCDGRIATIGTVNLDFRSLFLHFENNSLFYESSIVEDLKKDMESTFEKCRERKLGDGLPGSRKGFIEALLRVIAPLL